ncbi:MAG TPA: MBL fold metallo-hydrolase [Candidatus Thalassarchaeaceae archaeon]|nr:MBL fold metallo-hydrolase [Candidatus Thalassarchaeaceae archaeon]
MASRLRVLGSGNAFCPPGRFHSCMLLDERVLIDAPPTILHQLQTNNISSSQITDLLITHWHGDHVFGLPFLLLDRRFISDREGKSRLRIHLHPNGIERMKKICELAFPNSLEQVIEERVEWIVNDTGHASGWDYERFPVKHTPETDPHGYLLRDSNGFVLLHTGDSGPCETIDQRIPNSHVILLEMGVPNGAEFPYHHRPDDIIRTASKESHKTFLITHSYASGKEEKVGFTMPSLPSNTIQIEDGQLYNLDISGIQIQ